MLMPYAREVVERPLNVRVVEPRRESVTVKQGRVEAVSLSHTARIGVRVLVDGSW
jgi:predicted Zn-dependent protease